MSRLRAASCRVSRRGRARLETYRGREVVTTVAGDAQRYRFGPREQRGIFGSLRAGQVIVLAVGLVTVMVLLQLRSALAIPVALVVGLAASSAAFWPIAGRTPEQWAPIVA